MYGIINLYKQKDISSFGQLRELKRFFGKTKIGHTGTLDPMADGVLVVCIGKATRLSDYIMSLTKEYEVEMILGFEYDSYDITGNMQYKTDVMHLKDDDILSVIKSFIGDIHQIPPIYSAKKVDGKKLYKYALAEEKVQIKPSNVQIHDIFEITVKNDCFNGFSVKKISFTVSCSKGTYIRSLCHDIGKKLEVCGVMSRLTRTKVGDFHIQDSLKVEDILKNDIDEIYKIFVPVRNAIKLPIITIDDNQKKKYLNGVKFHVNYEQNEYIIEDKQNIILGIGTVDSKNYVKNKVMLYENN